MDRRRGIRVKDGDVGIQGEDQIGKLELIEGLKQVPAELTGRVALIPFQIQEPDIR
jgi:hypothetical protein